MIDRLNYAAHAIESIEQQQHELARLGAPGEPDVAWVIDQLNRGVKFILPDHGELIDLTGFDQKHADLIKLPYPITVIEAPFPPRPDLRMAENKQASTRRIGLYIEMPATEVLHRFPGAERPDPESFGVLVVAIYYIDALRQWELSGCAAFVPYDQIAYNRNVGTNTPASMELFADVAGEGRRLSKMAIRSSLVPLRPQILFGMRNAGMSDDSIKATMLGNLLDEQIMLVQLCTVLNCGNVEQVDLPVPVKLARAREKSGKIPLYDYKVLTLTGEVTGKGSFESERQGGGLKRTHLRRGHIRRIAGERTTWVRAALINAGAEAGRIDKSYRVVRP
jgi:hypothetical protein